LPLDFIVRDAVTDQGYSWSVLLSGASNAPDHFLRDA